MASSDDDGETFPDAILDYSFYNKDDDPVSFIKLPVQWNENESSSADAEPIYLRGLVDNGMRMFYQQVKAWKYDMLTKIPKISVLYKDNRWIKLEKPKKSYEYMIRTTLISVHCLCFLKSKPDAPEKSLWNHLSKVFSMLDVNPSENDLIDHISFIKEAVKRDDTLTKTKFLAEFLDNPRKRNSHDEDVRSSTKPSFIVDDIDGGKQDDDIITNQTEDTESDEEDDQFDSVCAICDDGGLLTCCDGECFRSFHATPDAAQDSTCESLGLTCKELEGMRHQQFKCENCKYSLHQCFVCAKLGSSAKSSNTEVFRCCSATCGHFYHPICVARLLQMNDKAKQQDLKEKIAAGEPFICPAHKCAACKQIENEKVEDLQFATCRRCPKSYHRKCLPSDIMFDHQIGDDDDAESRAWNGLLSRSRALIYCVEHEIDPELHTPARPIIFKDILYRKKQQPDKKKIEVKLTDKKSVMKSQKGVENFSVIKPEGSSKKRTAPSSCSESSKKKRVADISTNPLSRKWSTEVKKPSSNDGRPTLGGRLYDYDLFNETLSNNLKKDDSSIDDYKLIAVAKSCRKEILPPLDDKSKQRILVLMKEADSSVTLDEVKKYHQEKVPSTHAFSSRLTIYLSRVEGSVEAINLAAKKLREGCSVEDVKVVCHPGVIGQLMRWKDRLRVYLAPFLHGMRYTSFGRHFTKVEKLEKIVDKLQWYIEDGDTVVDFCCGANDFSCLMKKRLDEMGKTKCSYKNYDIKQPKNDFNFEKRDWMKVSPDELPDGSRLIMGLNPPFGMKASLANQFVANALLFKPKLIILIVPPETQRLDSQRRRTPYDLIWEDADLLAGKSFYFPGSSDVNGKQVDQWNNIAPPLYLWSRPDWTNKHKFIAHKHGHITLVQKPPQFDENRPEWGFPVGNNELKRTIHAAKWTDDQEERTYQNSRKNVVHEQGSRYRSTDGKLYNRTNTYATQRYAPRLDELNNVRVNNLGRSGLEEMNSARIHGGRQPELHMGSHGVGGYGPPVIGPGSHKDSVGFAPGLNHQYSQHNSSRRTSDRAW